MTIATALVSHHQPRREVARDGCTVLVVDADERYRHALASGLALEGFAVELAKDGHEGLQLFHQVLPRSGVARRDTARSVRDRDLPEDAGSATGVDHHGHRSARRVDVVLSLELGASDYVAKPFRLRELVARMRAVLRRASDTREQSEEVLQVGPVRLDAGRREVAVHNVPVKLSGKEFDVLALLMAHSGQVVTRDDCLDDLWWDQELNNSRTLDTHIKRLRRKIEPDPANPCHLLTVRGVGFRFEG